jgi:hypothetical protein
VRRRANLLLLALLALCALSFWLGRSRPDRDGNAAGSPAAGTERTSPWRDAAGQEEGDLAGVHVAVLNGTGEAGLAQDLALGLTTLGCVVARVANAPHDGYSETLLVNRRLPAETASALARRLGGVRVIREWDPRAAEDAVLVLGADHRRVGDRLLKTATP